MPRPLSALLLIPALMLLSAPLAAEDPAPDDPLLPTVGQLQQRMDLWLRDARVKLFNSLPTLSMPSLPDNWKSGWDGVSPPSAATAAAPSGQGMACLQDPITCYQLHKPDLLKKCESNGNPLACLQLGSLAQETGNLQEAVNPLRMACGSGGSSFGLPGTPGHYGSIACSSLGRMAEQAGDMATANQYYDLGCVRGNPIACLMGEGNAGF